MVLADPSTTRLGYRPELDGIRALAVLAVMLGHSQAYLGAFRYWGGFYGVDVFFVLSGFLITTLLDQEIRHNGRARIGAFYLRRALRLLPALCLALILGALTAWRVGSNVHGYPYLVAALAALLYVGNWVQIRPPGLGLLTHTWSLGVEEQYYLVWPHALRLGRRVLRSNARMALLAACAAVLVGLLRCILLAQGHIRFATTSSLTRADGVLWGSALALALSTDARRLAAFLRRGITALVAACAVVGLTLVTLGGLAAYARLTVVELGAAIVIGHLALRRDGLCARVLSLQPLPAIGRISSGLYLYHLPLFVLIHGFPRRWTGGVSVATAFAATFALATASFLVVERPLLRLKSRFEPELAGANRVTASRH